mmetsp:Transcript_13757/g.43294  ORF Transcript_13757/g.43294 Transcript_13757/m.43294 type:complete len:229 (-) Transcript_13757:1838-2524(-)
MRQGSALRTRPRATALRTACASCARRRGSALRLLTTRAIRRCTGLPGQAQSCAPRTSWTASTPRCRTRRDSQRETSRPLLALRRLCRYSNWQTWARVEATQAGRGVVVAAEVGEAASATVPVCVGRTRRPTLQPNVSLTPCRPCRRLRYRQRCGPCSHVSSTAGGRRCLRCCERLRSPKRIVRRSRYSTSLRRRANRCSCCALPLTLRFSGRRRPPRCSGRTRCRPSC